LRHRRATQIAWFQGVAQPEIASSHGVRGDPGAAYFAIPRALKPTVLSRQIEENGRKVLPIALA
jgi:hypothetical protein